MPEDDAVLVAQAEQLLREGQALHPLKNPAAMMAWDNAVNDLLADIDAQVAEGTLTSRRLKRRLDQLIQMYRVHAETAAEEQKANDKQEDALRSMQEKLNHSGSTLH